MLFEPHQSPAHALGICKSRLQSIPVCLHALEIIFGEENYRGEVTAHPLVIANMLNKGALSNSYWSNYRKNTQISCARGGSLQQKAHNPLVLCVATKHAHA